MDPKTTQHYADRAKGTTSRYNAMKEGGVGSFFLMAFSQGSRILEIGSGSGRDLAQLRKQGFDAWGVDASEEMVRQSLEEYPELKGRCEVGSIPDDTPFFSGNFDGILCAAVLQHVENEHLFDAAFTLKRNLGENGKLLLSIPLERDDLDGENRDPHGRLHLIRHPEEYILLFERLGFSLIWRHESPDGLGREGIRWESLIFELRGAGALRPIDMIESVLNRDKKTATYKLALFRALAEISSQEYHSVKRYPDGRVGVPLERIAEKWVYYYWPIFEWPLIAGKEFIIPQKYGETSDCAQPVAFRKVLTDLIRHYRPAGGLGGFVSDIYHGSMEPDTMRLYSMVIRKIADAVRNGPVKFAGGSLDNRLFDYDRSDGMVLVDPSIWRELSLMWHWIRDALILRWGELTERMSQGSIELSEAIDLMLQRSDEKRDTVFSREIFDAQTSLECVWTGQTIQQNKYDVDHVIPYSLWHNNDLWNLLPAHPKVNNKKRDLLPSRELMTNRREVMIHYWQLVYVHSRDRFLREVQRLAGPCNNGNWEEPLFNAVYEAVEYTALQRGVERWNG